MDVYCAALDDYFRVYDCGVTWYREQYCGVKFSAWPYLVSAFVTATTAYGLKKWREDGSNAPSNPVRTEGTGDRESG